MQVLLDLLFLALFYVCAAIVESRWRSWAADLRAWWARAKS
jgi:hypothetical protein